MDIIEITTKEKSDIMAIFNQKLYIETPCAFNNRAWNTRIYYLGLPFKYLAKWVQHAFSSNCSMTYIITSWSLLMKSMWGDFCNFFILPLYLTNGTIGIWHLVAFDSCCVFKVTNSKFHMFQPQALLQASSIRIFKANFFILKLLYSKHSS